MGVVSSKSSASQSTDTSKGEAERFYSCCGTLKQAAKFYCTINIGGVVALCSPLIDKVRIKNINFSDSEGGVEHFLTSSTRISEVEMILSSL